jgi:hypothetical protein
VPRRLYWRSARDSNEPKKSATIAEDEQQRQESLELLYDWFKHLTTLCTGTILLSAALVQGLFNGSRQGELFILSVTLLMASLVTSAIAMMAVILDIRKPYTGQRRPKGRSRNG